MLFVARVAKYTKQSLAYEHPNIFSVLCYSCTVYLLVVKLASYDSYPSYKYGQDQQRHITTNDTSYSITGLEEGSKYNITVSAGELSNTVSAVTIEKG